MTPLHIACMAERVVVTSALLGILGAAAGEAPRDERIVRACAAVDRRGRGSTPLHYAVQRTSFGEALKSLIAESDVGAVDHCGLTPLHYAKVFEWVGGWVVV
eukprot:gene1265-37942_t